MQLHSLEQTFQNGSTQTGLVQNSKAGIGRGGIHQRPADRLRRTAECCMGAEQLGPAVGLTGVGVHNTARQLDQLAHMPDQKHLLKMLGRRHIQRVTDKI